MTDLVGWPFNKYAVSAQIALLVMLAGYAFGATIIVILGAWMTAVTCAGQICLVIREANS